MAIQVQCACGRQVTLPGEFAGRRGRCPACGQTLEIPQDPQAVPDGRAELALKPAAAREGASSSVAEAPERLAICARCERAVTGEGNYCTTCGAPVRPGIVSPEGALCPACRKLVPAEARVCSHCNARLPAPAPAGAAAFGPAGEPKERPARPSAYGPPPGLAMGNALKWTLTGLLACGLLLGGWGLVRFFKRMNFDACIRDGDGYLAGEYPGEAEAAFRKAQEIFPDDPVPKKKLEEVAAYRQFKESMRLKGLSVGPAGHQMVNRIGDMQRRMTDLENSGVRPVPAKPPLDKNGPFKTSMESVPNR